MGSRWMVLFGLGILVIGVTTKFLFTETIYVKGSLVSVGLFQHGKLYGPTEEKQAKIFHRELIKALKNASIGSHKTYEKVDESLLVDHSGIILKYNPPLRIHFKKEARIFEAEELVLLFGWRNQGTLLFVNNKKVEPAMLAIPDLRAVRKLWETLSIP